MKLTGILLIVLTIMFGCSQDDGSRKYERLVKNELAAKKRVDSIFFDIHLGMVRKDFYTYCWEMNKKGIFTDGAGNNYVLFKLKNELNYPADMNFYPDFNDSTIWRMRVNIQYEGWAPWNKHLNADSLLPDVLAMCNKWYSGGNPFIRLNDEKSGPVYVKVDGNRKIAIKKADDIIVHVAISDLLVENQRISKEGE